MSLCHAAAKTVVATPSLMEERRNAKVLRNFGGRRPAVKQVSTWFAVVVIYIDEGQL